MTTDNYSAEQNEIIKTGKGIKLEATHHGH